MRGRIRAGIAAIVAAGLVAGGAVAAHATTEYVGGGKWSYGVYEPANTVYVYSNYYHPSKKHRSTVQVHNGTQYRSKDAPAGKTAEIERATSYGGNKAWWYAY
ncbi:lactococcin 972 family bacteriocin [Homoserinibacter sp. GY 40078]|uniref:lactococcin 972 family bacteriocin n=1 Tax=Homoserinibacter sp. GY 40078 TaxID=2603275 RepID=UPI0011CAB3A6|nr:lactococcin 972 family bacteriocin [Homoserinibacter sp. GY 40078]TXK18985.1 lactococcin 972 family bacteriocin [Homoserinibacter sp. GY 40078]